MPTPVPIRTPRTDGLPANLILDSLRHPVLALAIGCEGGDEVIYANAAAQTALGGSICGLSLRDLFPNEPHLAAFWLSGPAARRVVTRRDMVFEAEIAAAGPDSVVISLHPAHSEGIEPGMGEADELTGLAKRQTMLDHLEATLASTEGGSGTLAVHALGLDRFGTVNDTLGHGVGDQLLKKVADRLRSACRNGECIARIGGDEFVILQSGIAGEADAEILARRLVDLVGRTYVIAGHTVNIGASLGVALSTGLQSARDLHRNAHLALLDAKGAGRDRHRFFEPAMDVCLRERREMEIDLRRALALKQFELHYQPFLALEDGRVMGFEALLRWDRPARGRVSPMDFIPLAEQTGIIGKIGEWVLRTACLAAAAWPEGLTVAVNVSPVQFQSDTLLATVVSALAQSGLAAERLELEITEGALLDNTEEVIRTLHSLHDLGVKISMDDFGTGYSSLSYLQKFPFSKIKIDRSFVQDADRSEQSKSILRAIAGLGVSLGMAITAEGVETDEQLERIRRESCTHVQGYLTGRPMPADAIPAFLAP